IVTTTGAHGPAGCTVNALMSLSVEPPLLLVSLCEDSRTLEAIRGTDLFGASILEAEQGELSERFCHCAPAERFAGLDLRGERDGRPRMVGAAHGTRGAGRAPDREGRRPARRRRPLLHRPRPALLRPAIQTQSAPGRRKPRHLPATPQRGDLDAARDRRPPRE